MRDRLRLNVSNTGSLTQISSRVRACGCACVRAGVHLHGTYIRLSRPIVVVISDSQITGFVSVEMYEKPITGYRCLPFECGAHNIITLVCCLWTSGVTRLSYRSFSEQQASRFTPWPSFTARLLIDAHSAANGAHASLMFIVREATNEEEFI